MLFRISVIALMFVAISSNARAQSTSQESAQESAEESAKPHCRPQSDKSVQVIEIIDAATLRLADGRIIKLMELETPSPIELHSNKLTEFLKKLALGKAAWLISERQNIDRYGRHKAHMFIEQDGRRVWVQAEIIEHGLALANPGVGRASPLISQCTQQLIELENQARQNNAGFWGNKIFQVRNAWDSKELLKYIQTFQIVQGRVQRLSINRGRLYINFGRNWKSDLTIVVNKSTMKLMQLGLENLDQIKGKTIRVRGWIEDNKGPLIRIRNPQQLEILEQP